MKRARRRFGPLFYLTATMALLVLISRPFWGTASVQYTAWRLTKQLRNPANVLRNGPAMDLVRLGPAATSWAIKATRGPDPRVRELACLIMLSTKPEHPDEVLAALLAAANDSVPAMRASAILQLGRMIVESGSSRETVTVDRAIRALGDALGDQSPQVRLQAVTSLAAAGPKARSVMGALEVTLDGPDKSTRICAADALLQIDADRTRARVIAAMLPMAKDPPPRLEHFRIVAILTSAQGKEATAAMLVRLLKDADPETRMTAIADLTAHSLGTIPRFV